ncbi:MAG: hypothetical protein LAO21_21825 [Acidobacteriia bacterium]|nr:hypothetical protein [Terriglobia bacterium]
MKDLPEDAAITYPNYFNLASGKYRLKMAVRDQGNLIGTVEQPLDIPAIQTGQFATSSLVLSAELQPVSSLLGNMEAQLLDEKNPLVFNGTRVYQSVGRKFYRNGRLILFFAVYNLAIDPTSKAPTLLLSYSVMTQEKTVYEQPLTHMTELPNMENGALPLALIIPLKQFPAGIYTVQVMVRDGLTHATRFIHDQIVVEPETPKK